MRDYQTKTNQGALPDSNSVTKYGAGEVNSLRVEAKTAVSRAGLTLAPQDGTGEDTSQLAQSLFINGVAGQAVQDSGAADAIVLTPVSGSSGLTLPPDYTTLDGAEFSFFAAFANATTTPTASIGQTAGTQFGAKTIVREDGSALAANDITPSVMTTLRRDDATDQWLLVRGAGVGAAGGKVVQMVDIQTGAVATGTTTTPDDDTIPQNTEGNEFMTLPITPTNASNILVIQVGVVTATSAAGDRVNTALFQDTTVDAIAAVQNYQSFTNVANVTTLTHTMTAGTTSSTTFKVRCGGAAAGTLTFNGVGGARKLGGVQSSYIRIWEIEP